MKQINTLDTVRTFATNCVNWLDTNNRITTMATNHDYYAYTLNLALHNFRRYLDKVLELFVDERVGKDTELDLGHYTLVSRVDKPYVVIKKSKRRLPRMSTAYMGWTTWDIASLESNKLELSSKAVEEIYGRATWSKDTKSMKSMISFMHASILSQVLLQSLFNIDGPIDLSSKPLPTQDIKCRVGRYEMLYDHLMQEWRIWKKN